MALFFVALAVLLLLPDAYILFSVVDKSPWWVKGLIMVPTLAYFGVIVRILVSGDYRQSMLNLLFWLTLCVVFSTLIFAVVSIIGKGVGLLFSGGTSICNVVALVLASGWLGMALYGITIGWKKIVVEQVEIASDRIPPVFNGYRIVQLSDFHIGTYAASPSTVAEIVERVNSLEPDLILFTGDLVNSSAAETDAFIAILSQLRATDGVYSVLGNHDYCLYRDYTAPDTPAKELAKVVAAEEAMGWKLLRNEDVNITRGTDSIAIAGVDNAGGHRFTDKSDLPRALRNISDSIFTILLSHDPSHWRREVLPASDVDLMLAGHTHAMQFKIGGWSPSAWTYKEWGGLYREGSRLLYVSTGIGENIAFRFGAWPQIVLLTLVSTKS